jgi:hypothetical protein
MMNGIFFILPPFSFIFFFFSTSQQTRAQHEAIELIAILFFTWDVQQQQTLPPSFSHGGSFVHQEAGTSNVNKRGSRAVRGKKGEKNRSTSNKSWTNKNEGFFKQ